MSEPKPVTIVGGGLAGLTLGIALRRLGIPVTVWEAGHYPRHRVCGEFISGKGLNVLERMELLDQFRQAGASLAFSAKFFVGTGETPRRRVDPPALCLSRYAMDQLLAQCFRREGGDLREHARYEDQGGGDGIVLANGRRAQGFEDRKRWFGLKIHAEGVELEADLEMHGFRHGYVGLCRLPGGRVNVCGLFQARRGLAGTPAKDLLKGTPGSALNRRLKTARLDDASFCSVAGLHLRRQKAANQAEFRLGDALTMIPPVTGNGMSMAFEAAEMSVEPVRAYAFGEISWSDVHQAVAKACDSAFRRRLLWAAWLQTIMFSPAPQSKIGAWFLNTGWLWDLVFARTR